MGKSSAEIQRGIERQRDALSARISRLEGRVRDDISTVRENASNRVSSAAEKVSSKTSSIAGSTAGSDSAIAGRPNTLVLGSLGAGFMLGLLTGGEDRDHGGHHDNGPSQLKKWWNESIDMAEQKASEAKQSVSDESKGIAGAVAGTIQGWVASEAAGLFKSAIDGITSGPGGDEALPTPPGTPEAGFEGEPPAARAMEEPLAPGGRPFGPAGYKRRAM